MALPLILVSQNVRYDRILEENTFILVIDRSGSMSGNAIQDTKTGSLHFISRMRKDDKACLITFSDNISVNVPITSDRGEIIRGVKSISASGGTKLYDALAMGVKQFFDDSGRRIIVYLTDGRDNGSNFSLDNMQSMFQGENIFVYGIGIGDVDNSSLSKISKVTGGNYHTISKNNTHKLSTIYFDVLSAFYTNHTNKITSHGALIVNSIPKGKIVRINGENSGMTPIKVTNLQPGQVSVEVYFENDKIWKENIEIKGGFTASVRAREIDALKNLWIISKPHGASVFIDGEYVGYTSNEIVNLKKRKWHKNVVKNPKELKVVGLKPDLHKIEIIGFPDFDYGPEQKVVVDYLLEGDDIIFIDIFKNVIKNKSGKVTPGKQRKDVFEF
ncbi:MAG: VWA domain-containing protein [Bacteroidetes bacterium]|nr:VWA domain-containing protein [Bacteroidota bacterium]